jgi:AcrR family transcriptional regulator
MARPKRHEETIATIKEIARQQMAVEGAAALSLGAIARAMGLTTPALYRYFANRDALVTELILDAYRDLSEETATAVDGIDPSAHRRRFRTLLDTYRRWALKHPQDYVLIHGAVLPGYEAPVEQVALAAFGGLQLLISVLQDADDAGLLRIPPAYRDTPPRIREALELLEGGFEGAAPPPHLLTLAFTTWLHLHGLVWQEIAGHLPPFLFDDGGLFELEINALTDRLGLGS